MRAFVLLFGCLGAVSGAADLPAVSLTESPVQKRCGREANQHLETGLDRMAKGNLAGAKKSFQKSLAKCAKNPAALGNRAAIFSAERRFDDAIRDYEAALKMDPGAKEKISPLLSSTFTERAKLAIDRGETQKAVADLTKAIQQDSGNAEAHSELAFLASQAGAYGDCEDLATLAIKADPKLAEAWANRGSCRYGKGDKIAALNDLEASLAIRKTPEVFLQRAVIHAGLKQCKQAKADFDEAVALRPDLAEKREDYLAGCAKK